MQISAIWCARIADRRVDVSLRMRGCVRWYMCAARRSAVIARIYVYKYIVA